MFCVSDCVDYFLPKIDPPELNCNENYEIKEKILFHPPCITNGLPKPEFSLYKNGKIIQHEFYPNWNDSGWYQLTAHNQHGTINSTFTISILRKRKWSTMYISLTTFANELTKTTSTFNTDAPVFYDSQEKFVAGEDSNIKLECNSTGNPEPEVWWSFNNKNISTGRRHINIERASSTDAGVYTCSATNKFGRSDKTFIVEIRGLGFECESNMI